MGGVKITSMASGRYWLFQVDTQMVFAALAGQQDLFLPLAEPHLVRLGRLVYAAVAGHAVFVFGALHILG